MALQQLTFSVEHDLVGQQAMDVLARIAQVPCASARSMTLNMAKVGRIDASGIAMLVRLYSQLRRQGIKLQVSEVNDSLAKELGRVAISAVVPVSVRADKPQRHSNMVRPIPV